jgi:hypothetical protein
MKRALCYLLITINIACIAMLALVPFAFILMIALAMVAVISLFLAYHSFRRKEASPGQDSLLIASIYLLPLLLFSLVYILVLLTENTTLFFVMLSVYYWLPLYPGLAHLFISAILLVLAWKYQSSFARVKTLLIIYTVDWVAFVAYVVWWYVTKQEFGHL